MSFPSFDYPAFKSKNNDNDTKDSTDVDVDSKFQFPMKMESQKTVYNTFTPNNYYEELLFEDHYSTP